MKKTPEIELRKSVWNVISEFYLDTELQQSDYDRISKILIASDLSIDQLKDIDRFEVFPILKGNLMSVAGEWSGFDEAWLYENCLDSYRKKNKGGFRFKTKVYHTFLGWMTKDHWKEIESRIQKRSTQKL